MEINDLNLFTTDSAYQGQSKTIDNPVFLIEHPLGRLIWDVGLPDELADRNPEEVDSAAIIVFHIREKLASQLSTMDLTPDSIDYLAVSHTHMDHVGNANYFANSRWIVDQNELNWARSEETKDTQRYYSALLEQEPLVYDNDHDVFGDNSVVILSMPGHTPGHSCLLLRMKNRALLLSGDLYHFQEQREYRRIPQFNFDPDLTRASMARFEELASKLGAKVIIQHESQHYRDLPVFPAFLE